MAAEHVGTSGESTGLASVNMSDLLDRLTRFEGPPEEFLLNLLAFQCHVSGAEGGSMLRTNPEGRVDVLSVYPSLAPGSTAPVWLAQAVELAPGALSSGSTTVRPLQHPDALYGQPAGRHLVLVPLRGGGGVRGLAAFLVPAGGEEELHARRERLELTISLLSLYEMRVTLQRRQFDLGRLRMAMETLSAVNEHDHFTAAGMAICNEVAARWQCERVALGFLKGRYVQLKALSHTEKFSRKMRLVQDIESVMEECLDQDIEVVHPADKGATYVARSAQELSRRHGPSAVVSLPLRRAGEPVAVLTADRPLEKPFNLDEVESLRLACELCTARLVKLQKTDRWFGARAAATVRKGLSLVLGPKHTWIKVAAIAILGALCFLTFVEGDYTVESPFVIEAKTRRFVPAPYDGYLKDVYITPENRRVEAGRTLLVELDTAELRLRRIAIRAQRMGELKKVAAARRDEKTSEAKIAQAEADKLEAQMDLLDYRIGKARIYAPIDGQVVTKDLRPQIGAPVKKGDTLFEIAQLDMLRAELSVPEDRIADVKDGQTGALATASYPGKRIRFRVERINPVAEVVKQRNVFKVRVELLDVDLAGEHAWLKPGLEGVAKIEITQRPYGVIWTRRLVNWVRMKLWI